MLRWMGDVPHGHPPIRAPLRVKAPRAVGRTEGRVVDQTRELSEGTDAMNSDAVQIIWLSERWSGGRR